eukprot:scaffold4534_cov85-Amphora_coffeaeformis.AAC.6
MEMTAKTLGTATTTGVTRTPTPIAKENPMTRTIANGPPEENDYSKRATKENGKAPDDDVAAVLLSQGTARICRSVAKISLHGNINWKEEETYEQLRSDIPVAVQFGVFQNPTVIIEKCFEIEDDQHCAIHAVNHMEQTIVSITTIGFHPNLRLWQKK